MRRRAILFYRLAVVVLLVGLIRWQHCRVLDRSLPVTVSEVAELLPSAHTLRADPGAHGALTVRDADGEVIGYVVDTMPGARDIIGYAGTSNLLIVMDRRWRVTAVRLRSSEDTARYVERVARDENFLQSWNGLTAVKAAAFSVGEGGLDAVAGATPTSRAVARAVSRTLATVSGQRPAPRRIVWTAADVALLAILGGALALAFGRTAGRRRWRLAFQVVVVAYFVFIAGDLLSLKLAVGWAKSGLPWASSPALVALLAVALLAPATTRKPVYCLHVCPHGAAQEWIGRVSRRRWGLSVRWQRTLRMVPFLLLALALAAAVTNRGPDLADLEPFVAYNVLRQSVGYASLAIGASGLIAAYFEPKAYCKYGCPTGLLLDFVRVRADEATFARRDVVAGVLVVLVTVLCLW